MIYLMTFEEVPPDGELADEGSQHRLHLGARELQETAGGDHRPGPREIAARS